MLEERTERPPKIRPPMEQGHRAKQFAPFESLGSMTGILKAVEENRSIAELEHIQDGEFLDYLCAEDMDIEGV